MSSETASSKRTGSRVGGGLAFERAYPYVLAGVFAAVYWGWGRSLRWPATFDVVLSGLLTLSGVCAGLIGVALTVLLALQDSARMQFLVRTGKFRFLVLYAFEGAASAVSAAALCCVLLWVEGAEGAPNLELPRAPWLVALTVFALASVLGTSFRIFSLLFDVLRLHR